ncbi:protein of unknown function [Methanoculleus bourgensis]|uniref:Transposase n=1 Tax=Methanoculleus bourgensis TaxID=83986 RepID=A0A0X3BJV2_9EURY|nr:protein of unknown function [Methanoculleus bourgensis]
MDPLALIEDYLSDQENGMKTLITWFLNQVMLQEALQQAGAAQYERTDARKAHRNGYKDRSLKIPKQHGKRIRTTNLMERVNKELKRRTKVVGAFPNEESLLRLVGSILMDINEEWVTGRRYLTMEKE